MVLVLELRSNDLTDLCTFNKGFPFCRSNFQFIWPWEEWAYVLDLPKWAPQRVFVQEVLEREVRLSYWDKVKQVINLAEYWGLYKYSMYSFCKWIQNTFEKDVLV